MEQVCLLLEQYKALWTDEQVNTAYKGLFDWIHG